MSNFKLSGLYLFLTFTVVCVLTAEENVAEMEEDPIVVDQEKVDYAKGSLCGYCDYCKVKIYTRGRLKITTTHV